MPEKLIIPNAGGGAKAASGAGSDDDVVKDKWCPFGRYAIPITKGGELVGQMNGSQPCLRSCQFFMPETEGCVWAAVGRAMFTGSFSNDLKRAVKQGAADATKEEGGEA